MESIFSHVTKLQRYFECFSDMQDFKHSLCLISPITCCKKKGINLTIYRYETLYVEMIESKSNTRKRKSRSYRKLLGRRAG